MEAAADTPRAYLSVAVPAYNEAENLPELYRRLADALDGIGVTWELVLVNNLSTDGTRDVIRQLAARDSRVRGVFLSRNFGLPAAHMAALESSSGTWTVIMDADLQDEPERIPDMLKLAEQGNDIVYGVRTDRGEGRLMRLATSAFYRLANRISEVPPPTQGGSFSILSRRVVDTLTAMPERDIFFPGLRAFVGFKHAELPLYRPARSEGRSRLGVRGKLSYGVNALLSFSNAPLRLAVWLGLSVALLSAILSLVFVYFKYFTDKTVPGFTALITTLLFLGGVQLLTLGVIGEYIGRIYSEVKRRPRYVIEDTVNVSVEPSDETEAVPARAPRPPAAPRG
jgi:polyisoprenyl-phosphate glycosyltransferase